MNVFSCYSYRWYDGEFCVSHEHVLLLSAKGAVMQRGVVVLWAPRCGRDDFQLPVCEIWWKGVEKRNTFWNWEKHFEIFGPWNIKSMCCLPPSLKGDK